MKALEVEMARPRHDFKSRAASPSRLGRLWKGIKKWFRPRFSCVCLQDVMTPNHHDDDYFILDDDDDDNDAVW